jgi:hypothetical protein
LDAGMLSDVCGWRLLRKQNSPKSIRKISG